MDIAIAAISTIVDTGNLAIISTTDIKATDSIIIATNAIIREVVIVRSHQRSRLVQSFPYLFPSYSPSHYNEANIRKKVILPLINLIENVT